MTTDTPDDDWGAGNDWDFEQKSARAMLQLTPPREMAWLFRWEQTDSGRRSLEVYEQPANCWASKKPWEGSA